MSTRTRRWTTILICLAIPVAVAVLGARAEGDRSERIDIKYPASCNAIYRQINNGQSDDALKAARKISSAPTATDEEALCTADAIQRLNDTPKLPEIGADTCALGTALAAGNAKSAAVAALSIGSRSRNPATAGCSTATLAQLGNIGEVQPNCAAVGRQLAVESEDLARKAILAALASANTTTADAACVDAVRQMLPSANSPKLTSFAGLDVPKDCDKAADLAAQGKLKAARNKYEDALDELDRLADSERVPPTDADKAERRLAHACATGGLQRLPERPTLADWTFERANHATEKFTGWIGLGPIVLAADTQALIVTLVWILTIGLVLVALRQFIRWRRERHAGPIKIAPIDAVGDDKVPVEQLIRHTLNTAGISPFRSKPFIGQVAIDVVDVMAAAGETGRVGKFVAAFKDALTVETGYTLTATPDKDPTAELPESIVVQLEDVATGETVCIETYRGATLREAAVAAALGAYLKVSARDEVLRRTPAYLRWISIDGLRAYHLGLEAFKASSFELALDHYRVAARTEVGNLAVHLAASDAYYALGLQLHDTEPARASDNFFKALVAALRAVRINGYSVQSHSQVALVAWEAAACADAWAASDERDEIIRLLGEMPGPDVRRYFRRLSDKEWRRALRRTWWPPVLYVGAWLDRRRTVNGYIHPFSRTRRAIHDTVLAGIVGTGYDVLTDDKPSEAAAWVDRVRLRFGLWRVRYGRLRGLLRSRDREVITCYNLAAAYVRRAVYRKDNDEKSWNMKAALRQLDRTYFGVGAELTEDFLREIDDNEDFDELRGTTRFKSWRARFREPRPDTTWDDRFDTLVTKCDAARRHWTGHRTQTIPAGSWWGAPTSKWADEVIDWFGDDVARLEALRDWSKDVASAQARSAFEKSVAPPPLNAGRPVSPIAVVMPIDPPACWKLLGDEVVPALTASRAALAEVVALAAAHDLATLTQRVAVLASERADRWAELVNWAANSALAQVATV